MKPLQSALSSASMSALVLLGACAAPSVDFSKMHQPPRASELAAYDIFVGSWNWEAEALNVQEPNRKWTGTAEWSWALDQRCLAGKMVSKTTNAQFEAEGVWSWNPSSRQYIWWMFNNWGYPQQGTADYDVAEREWEMKYSSVGLDGTPSHGEYVMNVVDNDTLSWELNEWADPLHTIKKLEMKGTYRRAK